MSPHSTHLFKRHGGADEEDEEEEKVNVPQINTAQPTSVGPIPTLGTLPTQEIGSTSSSTSSNSSIAQGNVNLAFGLVVIAAFFGLIGSVLGVYIPRRVNEERSKQFLAASLSLSGGILVFLALTDILVEARAEFRRRPSLVNRKYATTITLGMFILGIVLYMCIKLLAKRFVPHRHVKEEVVVKKDEEVSPEIESLDSVTELIEKAGLKTSSVEIAIALALHNIPEGIILFTSTLSNSSIGINLAIGLIFHKLPEGLIIAMPFYAATKSVWKSLMLAFVASSFFLFLGALLSYIVFTNFWNPFAGGVILALTSGVLFWLGITVILPLANKMDPEGSIMPYGILAGVFVMCISSVILSYP